MDTLDTFGIFRASRRSHRVRGCWLMDTYSILPRLYTAVHVASGREMMVDGHEWRRGESGPFAWSHRVRRC